MRELGRITARRSELDALAEELAKQLQEVQAAREELVIAERILNRLAEQDRAAAEAAAAVARTPAREETDPEEACPRLGEEAESHRPSWPTRKTRGPRRANCRCRVIER